MIPASTYHGIQTVAGLRRGRSVARETESVESANPETVDAIIRDGLRRYAAIKFLGVRKVMASIRPDISRKEDRVAFLSLLKSCNTQRVKTRAEVVREGIVAMDDDATQRLYRYISLPPRKEMIDRFKASGREKLIVIMDLDLGPEGCDIPNSFGLSLRDDFKLDQDQLAPFLLGDFRIRNAGFSPVLA